MLRWLNSRKGQNTAEYAILIGVIVAAAIAMQIYVRRGMQAKYKEATDFAMTADTMSGVPEAANLFTANQYEPYYLATNYVTTQQGAQQEQMQTGGGVVRSSISDVTQRTGNQTYSDYRNAM